MKLRRLQIAVLLACSAFAAGVWAQPSIPNAALYRLPNEDFVYTWGNSTPEERSRTHFQIEGREAQFFCRLSGRFRPGSRMSDFYNLRAFEQELIGTLYFIRDATYRMNELDFANELDWALLECTIPDYTADEEKAQERVDRALERAQRERERRRAREERDDD